MEGEAGIAAVLQQTADRELHPRRVGVLIARQVAGHVEALVIGRDLRADLLL